MLLQQSNHVRNFCDGFYLTEKPAAHFYTERKKRCTEFGRGFWFSTQVC